MSASESNNMNRSSPNFVKNEEEGQVVQENEHREEVGEESSDGKFVINLENMGLSDEDNSNDGNSNPRKRKCSVA